MLALTVLQLVKRDRDGADAVVAREAVVVVHFNSDVVLERLVDLERELLVPLGVEGILLLLRLLRVVAAAHFDPGVRVRRARVVRVVEALAFQDVYQERALGVDGVAPGAVRRDGELDLGVDEVAAVYDDGEVLFFRRLLALAEVEVAVAELVVAADVRVPDLELELVARGVVDVLELELLVVLGVDVVVDGLCLLLVLDLVALAELDDDVRVRRAAGEQGRALEVDALLDLDLDVRHGDFEVDTSAG
mmetsp:Transcript_8269/g.25865  ORF Transcript_8269/g.25865 Transcript_8269/m.25865 type:complete len:248 (-) Transcript_8269:54-797(-)